MEILVHLTSNIGGLAHILSSIRNLKNTEDGRLLFLVPNYKKWLGCCYSSVRKRTWCILHFWQLQQRLGKKWWPSWCHIVWFYKNSNFHQQKIPKSKILHYSYNAKIPQWWPLTTQRCCQNTEMTEKTEQTRWHPFISHLWAFDLQHLPLCHDAQVGWFCHHPAILVPGDDGRRHRVWFTL